MVCRLNVYVGKERMLVLPVVIPVAMTQKAVAMVVRGNRDTNYKFSPCHQALKLCIFKPGLETHCFEQVWAQIGHN